MVQLENTDAVQHTVLTTTNSNNEELLEQKVHKINKLHEDVDLRENKEEQIDYKLVDELIELVRSDYEINKDKYSQDHYLDIINPSSIAVCWRYLLYTELCVEDSFELIKRSLIWRKENNVEKISDSNQPKEFWLFGPIHRTGKAKDGTDLIYINGKDYRKANSEFSKVVIKFAINFLFDYDKKNINNFSKVTLVFDTTDCGFRNIDLDFMYWLISVLDYLPERIATSYVIGVPFLLRPLIKLIISWAPYKLSSIVQVGTFSELVEKNIDLDYIPAEVGGRGDNSFRLAPPDSPWLEQLEELNTQKLRDAIEYSLLGNFSTERREQLRAMQINYENSKY